ncbi:prepilin-type N-terminal cleavage/methylation domain-containing protein [Coralloluteibacterium thermophilus]|uniref:Prepilin-type N-terminal cleavage/methylation domain-containing protein n=1 Tax=Coralloluteibacterium thermophilum TaxID=2707049 RepID=A0ABV9NR32_9GAMM
MPTSATGRADPAHGFSLIELLVGLVVLGVLAGAATLAFPRSAERRVEADAERVAALIELACERAEVGGRDVAIALGTDALRFGPVDGGRWRPIGDDPADALRPRRLDVARLRLRIDGREMPLPPEAPATPQLGCSTDAELTPFELDVVRAELPGWRLRSEGARVLREPLAP